MGTLSDITDNNNNLNFTYYLAACDDSDLCSGSSSGIFEINRQPNITIPNVLPASPNTTSTLDCNYSYSDQDNDTELSIYRWYVAGALSSYNTKQINAANTTKLETWKCEVTPADEHNFTNAAINSTNTVNISNTRPVIYSVQCHNGTGNINCNNITYGINLTNITVNCTDPDNDITNVSLQLFNRYDGDYKINTGNITNNVNGSYVYNYKTLIEDSGNWTLNVSCIDTSSAIDNYTTNFSLAFGSLSPFLIFPSSENRDVATSAFFNFTSGVYCIGGECENISVILDPGNLNVIFTDQFEESTINTSRWNITGSPNITNATSYTGNKSLIVNTSIISYITKNFTDSIKVGNLSVWFYDPGETNLTYESQLAVLGGEVPFSIGVNATLNQTHYSYFLNGTFFTEVARSIGWHSIFVKVSTVTRLFIDSISIRNTSLITTFTGFELGARQTSNNTAYFDDFNYTVACEDSEAECKSCSNRFNYTTSFPDTQAEGTYFGNCCGDDSSESYINTTAATDSTAACCNSSTSCIEGSTCFKAGTNTTNYFCTSNDSKLCGQDADNDFALDNDNNASGQGTNETTRDFEWNYCFGNEDAVCGNESNGGDAGDLCDYFGDRTSGHGVCTKFFNNGTTTANEQNDSDLTCAYSSAGYVIIATILQDSNRTGCSLNEGNCTLNETNMIALNSSTLLSNYADRHCVSLQTFDIRNEILNYEIDDDGNACVGCNYTLGTQTCSGAYDYNCTNTNTCEGVCGASSACDESSASGCASNSTLGYCSSACQINNTFETSQSACDCNQGSTACSGGSCFNTTGNIIAFPTAEGILGNCCGNNANETFRAATFNSSLTVSDTTRGCCNSTTSCTFNNSCYKNQTYLDVDVNADNDTCVEGTWYDCLNNSDCASDNHCYRRDCDQNPRVRNITISDANVYFEAIIRCIVNVTDAESMSNVRFNISAPSGALYQSNGVYDGTQWLSASTITNETGTWNCTSFSNDSSGYGITNTTNFTVFKKSELNNGVVSIVNGTKPFYTISRNPTNISYLACLSNLKGGQSCNQTWSVNASGSIGTKFEFYTIYNSTHYNNISAKVNVTIAGNVTPIVTLPVIIPATPYRNNNLNCSWTVLDQDSANATVNITWSLNGITNKTETITCLESTTCYAPAGILNTTITKLQNWSCDVRAFDGNGYSASKNLTAMIQNSPPAQTSTILNISWNEDNNNTDALNLAAYFTDIDSDTLNYTTASTQNVTVTLNYTSFNISLSPTADYNAELYTAQYIIINATDGTNTTSSNRVYLTIANTADCGSNGCESGESCSSCSSDCGQCSSQTGGGAAAAPAIIAVPKTEPTVVAPVEQKINIEQEAPPAVIAPAVVVQAEAAVEAAVEAPTVIEAPTVVAQNKEAGGASNEIKVTLKESQSTIIEVGNEEHTVTIDKINYVSSIAINSIDLVIQSRYIKLNILIGETKYIDFEDDKKDDLSVTLLEITDTIEGKQATLKIIDLKTGKALINKLFTLFKQDNAVAIQDAAACININKNDKSKAAQEKVEIRQTTLDAKTELPKGLDMAVQPFALNCQGSTVSLTLNIPNNIVDLQALRCNKGVCENIGLTRLDELNCGNKIKEDTSSEEAASEQAAAAKIIERNESSNETFESRNKVKVIGILDEELAKQIMPKITVPDEEIKQPENPNLKILSPPINIEFSESIGNMIIGNSLTGNSPDNNLGTEIVMPYVTDPQVDKNSISIYAKNIQLNEWELITSRINTVERTVTAIVRNASKYLVKKEAIDNETQSITQIYTGEFTLIGTICKNCEFSAFENIYFPAETSKATVILVHGLGSTPASFNAIINDIRLTKQPWQAWTFGYSSSRSSLDNGIELA
ncbi:hypothetical protein J4206_04910, partial [Candidatus Woesearchaeota archaeon]|nr:hypothetical protein [Candidatus Woesearchaeota archaeon]